MTLRLETAITQTTAVPEYLNPGIYSNKVAGLYDQMRDEFFQKNESAESKPLTTERVQGSEGSSDEKAPTVSSFTLSKLHEEANKQSVSVLKGSTRSGHVISVSSDGTHTRMPNKVGASKL